QIGVTALSLVIGRLLHDDEYPEGAADVLELASAISASGEHKTLPEGLRKWIGRALQLDPNTSFANALEARDDLERVLAEAGEEDDDESVLAPTPSPAVPIVAERAEPAVVEPARVELSKPEPFKPEPPVVETSRIETPSVAARAEEISPAA